MPRKKQDAPRLEAKTNQKKVKAASGQVYQVKISLDDVKPPIWRRVLTKDCTLAQLHEIIQRSMGWHDCHLHQFEIGGERFGLREQWEADFGPDMETVDSHKVKLSHIVARGYAKLRYVYDMGDGWEHTISIEKTMEAEPKAKYPRCIDGRRACPPEDCGGPWGYADFLQAIRNPKHARHADLVEWIGGEFDPEAFDLEEVAKS